MCKKPLICCYVLNCCALLLAGIFSDQRLGSHHHGLQRKVPLEMFAMSSKVYLAVLVALPVVTQVTPQRVGPLYSGLKLIDFVNQFFSTFFSISSRKMAESLLLLLLFRQRLKHTCEPRGKAAPTVKSRAPGRAGHHDHQHCQYRHHHHHHHHLFLHHLFHRHLHHLSLKFCI